MRRRALALMAAALLLFTIDAGVLADAPGPGSISASVSGSTATVSGSWTWKGADKCTDQAVGWAVDWKDPSDPGNAVKNGVSVGTQSDNSVHTNGDCGAITSGKDRGGSWGSLSHTYSSPGTYNVCVVMYDVHLDKGQPKTGDLVAGGSGRNKDNSVESAGAAGGSCTSLTIATPANISVRMTVSQATAEPGDTLTYTIILSNSGGTAGTVDVSDNIGSLLAKSSFQGANNGGSLNGSTVSWNNVSVAAGGSVSLTMSIRLDTTGWSPGTASLTNTVVAAGTNCAPGSGAEDCRASTTVSPTVNLTARMAVNRATAAPGDTLTYTISVQNAGKADAAGVSVSDNIASLLARGTFGGATNGGALSGSTVSWSNLSIGAGGTADLGFSVTLSRGGWGNGTTTLANTAVVPNSDCASGASNTNCRTTTTVSVSPNLVVRQSVSATTANPGDTLDYTISVQNTGTGDATNVTVSNSISALLAHGSVVATSSGGSLSGSTLSWSNLSLDAGTTQTMTFAVKLDTADWPVGTTTLTNTVVVAGSDCASGSSNAACRVSTTVTARPNLVVRKSVSATTANPGDSLTYTITVQNTGNATAANVDVTDDISALLAHGSFVSASGGGSFSGSTVRWSNLSVTPGTTQAFTFSVKLDLGGWATGTTTLPNTAVVAGSDCASGSSNSACRVSTSVTARPNLVVRKSVSATTANPGDSLTYTITVQNTGNATATNVDVADDISPLLAHGSFGSASSGGSLSGSTVRWSNLSVAPGATQTFTFSVKLDSSGWATGTTTLANTVVVAGSDCASGASNAACRVSTTVTARPNLVVRKSVSATTANPGDSLTYTITVQNTGNATAANVDVTDDISSLLAHGSFGSASNGGSFGGSTVHWDNVTVAPNATQSFTFSVKLDLGGWATGTTTLANTVVVAGSDCASGASNAACRVSTTISPRFSLSLTKGAAGGSSGPWVANYSATAGDTVWYQVRVTNTGNAAVTGVQVSDSLGFPAGQCATPPSSLTPGAGWTCVYFRTVTEGTITNTATADSAQTSSVTDTATVVAGPAPAPDIAISKTASPTQLPVGGGNVTYTIMVTNPGNVALSNVTVSDDHCVPLTLQGGDANDNSRLDPNESWRYTCGATLTTSTTNTATAAGTYGSTRVSATAKATVTVLLAAPGLHLEKSASPESLPVGGGTATYTYVVTNIGNAALSNVGVTDDKCSPVTYVSGDENSNNRLDLTETWRFTCSATLTVTTTNHARATGSTGDVVASDTDQATVTVAESQPAIRVVAAANPTSLPPGGGQVTWTYVVTNPGNSALTGVTLSDQACTSIALLGGDTNGNNRLDLGETWQFRCSANITATTTSTVTATGHAGTATVADTDSTTVAVTASSTGINVVKTANPTTLPAAGGSVTYTYVVTNKGNVALSGVSVVDDKCTTVSARGGDANGNSRLDPGETWTYTCVATITQTTTNTALATGFYETLPVTDTDTALVTVGTPAQHTPRIGLTLSASPVVLPDGGGEVTYTYAVANKGDVPLANVTVKDDTCAPLGTPTGDTDGNGVLDLTEVWTYTCTMLVTANTSTTATASGQADGQTVEAMDIATVTLTPPAPTATPSESPTPTGAAPTGSGGSSPGTSPTGGTAGSTGTGTSSSTPGGAVAGATSPAKSSAAPTNTGLQINTGTTPSGLVMILVLMLGIAAAVLIMTLSKRTSNL